MADPQQPPSADLERRIVLAAPGATGLQNTVQTGVSLNPFFGNRYRTPAHPKLDQAMAHCAKMLPDVPLAIVDLNPNGSRGTFYYKGGGVYYSASLIKIAAMYGAFALRRVLRAFSGSNGGDHRTVIARAAAHFRPHILAAAKKLGPLSTASPVHLLPRYAAAFVAMPGSSVPRIEFTSDFESSIELMMVPSDNISAGRVVQGVGYGYINGALERGHFAHRRHDEGIWLAADYWPSGTSGKYPAFRVASKNDPTTAQGGATLHLARMTAMIVDKKLVGSRSSGQMYKRMRDAQGVDSSWLSRLSAWSSRFDTLATKIGLGPLDSGDLVYSEVLHAVHKNTGREFVVAHQNLLGHQHHVLANALAKGFDAFL